MGRRKKKSQNDDSFDEEVAIEIYTKRKSFERPENKGLETVFEGEGKEKEHEDISENAASSRSRAPRASKKLQPKLRMISTQPYYIEDDDKTALRKKQTAKLFKGRKKFKWKGLSTKQEEKLIQSIAEKTDTDIDTEISEGEEEEKEKKEEVDAKTPFIVVNDISKEESFHTPPSSFAETKDEDQVNINENTIKEADAFLGPLGFSDDEDTDNNIQSTFKPIKAKKVEKENAGHCNDRRKSKITKVRRSSRIFQVQNSLPLTDNSNSLGSIFQDVEIGEKPNVRRSRRRSSKPQIQEIVNTSSPVKESMPCMEALRL